MAGESDLRTVSANHVLGVDHQERKCDSDASDAEGKLSEGAVSVYVWWKSGTENLRRYRCPLVG